MPLSELLSVYDDRDLATLEQLIIERAGPKEKRPVGVAQFD